MLHGEKCEVREMKHTGKPKADFPMGWKEEGAEAKPLDRAIAVWDDGMEWARPQVWGLQILRMYRKRRKACGQEK